MPPIRWQSVCVCVCVCVCVQSCPTRCDTVDCMYPSRLLLPKEFFRQKYWSGLPFSSSRGSSSLGNQPCLESTALACRFFTTRATLHSVGHSLLSPVWHSLLDSFQACNVTQHLPPWRCYLDGTYSLSHLPEETSFKEIFIKAMSNFNSYSLFFYFLIFELKIKFLTYTIKKPHLKIMCNGIFKIYRNE